MTSRIFLGTACLLSLSAAAASHSTTGHDVGNGGLPVNGPKPKITKIVDYKENASSPPIRVVANGFQKLKKDAKQISLTTTQESLRQSCRKEEARFKKTAAAKMAQSPFEHIGDYRLPVPVNGAKPGWIFEGEAYSNYADISYEKGQYQYLISNASDPSAMNRMDTGDEDRAEERNDENMLAERVRCADMPKATMAETKSRYVISGVKDKNDRLYNIHRSVEVRCKERSDGDQQILAIGLTCLRAQADLKKAGIDFSSASVTPQGKVDSFVYQGIYDMSHNSNPQKNAAHLLQLATSDMCKGNIAKAKELPMQTAIEVDFNCENIVVDRNL
ncbi:MAG: hypothetical protein ABIR96_12230 [Bdellovibrionota bacterium]